MNPKKVEWLFGIMFSAIGLIFLIVGIFAASYNINFKNNALETTADRICVYLQKGYEGKKPQILNGKRPIGIC